ncbi:hypothetical protein LCGC14_1197620 [marine sediment metagenome]|uniref:Methyltransferase type 11 domain-containing protein n=1 Tax=marine sediment metagenome TaxID=412755 RepID=A0A0F9M558_9ZZZZ|nr:class I SAM-dependent methyltransferase [Candidatus Aminicenantes bacterium]
MEEPIKNKININEGVRVQEVHTCLLCNSKGILLYQDLRDRLFNALGNWSLIRCQECGLVWLNPQPIPENIGKLYANYFTHSIDIKNPILASLRKKVWRILLATTFGYNNILNSSSSKSKWIGKALSLVPLLKERVESSIMYLNGSWKGKLLDIGCGNGQFLATMRDLGWEIQGIEPDKQAARFARDRFGIQVIASTLEEAKIPNESFDAIILRHVIEHVSDAIRFLEKCHRILKPTGKLVILTPNIESMAHRIFKESWRDLDPPRHFYLFSLFTLRICAERAGFQIEILVTTAQSAKWVWLRSKIIQNKGTYSKIDITKMMKMKGVAFQFLEAMTRNLWKNIGEELLLIASKKQKIA